MDVLHVRRGVDQHLARELGGFLCVHLHAGAGIALQPCWMVDEALRRGELVRVLPRWTGPAQTAHIVHAPRRRLPMRVQAVMDHVVAAVATW